MTIITQLNNGKTVLAKSLAMSANIGDYHYTLKSTGYSSKKYGDCEICGDYANEVFLQRESRCYQTGTDPRFTQNGCVSLFGHEACLLEARK